MAKTLSLQLPPLSLDLPNTRMSVDFSKFSTDFTTPPTSKPRIRNGAPRTNKPQPPLPAIDRFHLPANIQRRPVPIPQVLPEVKEEREPSRAERSHAEPSPEAVRRWLSKRSTSSRVEQQETSVTSLSRANSNASSISSATTLSMTSSSVFSIGSSTSTARTTPTPSMRYSNPFDPCPEEAPTLSTLPHSLVEHIISYALCLPMTVSIGPQENHRHMQYRYHREGLDYMDIQLILKHPIFMVSRQIREVALDVFHRKCDFVVDLHRIYHTKVKSTMDDNMKKYQKFWMAETPKMVRDSLRSVSRLHLRLPVPSTEEGVRRGRDEDDWMDGSDGKGGGSWRVKSMKREQDDAMKIQECLEAIKELFMTDPGAEPKSRSRSRSLSRMSSMRRSPSLRRTKSKRSEQRGRSLTRTPDGDDDDGKRKPLKRLEVTLIKRSSHAMVLPEALGLVRILRAVPVTGFTKYLLELEGQKVVWATKYRKKWQGMEPDGPRLLNDLQGLTVADVPIEPIVTPKQFQFVDSKGGKLQLAESAIPKTPIVLDRPNTAESEPMVPQTPQNVRRKPLPWSFKRSHKRKDSFAEIIDEGLGKIGSSGTTTSGREAPPTVEELQKIADDIRNGLY